MVSLRKAFDPDSGLDHPGQGHYPQCLVSTVYDVFRRLPIARTVQSIAHANEREEVKVLLPRIPLGGVLLFDRGYPVTTSSTTCCAGIGAIGSSAVPPSPPFPPSKLSCNRGKPRRPSP